MISSGLLNRFYARGENIIRAELALASSIRFPNAQGYTGVRARGRGPEAVVQQSNDHIGLAEVPGKRPDCYEGQGPGGELLPGRWGQEVHVIHSVLYNHPKWIKFSFGKLLVPDTTRMVIK